MKKLTCLLVTTFASLQLAAAAGVAAAAADKSAAAVVTDATSTDANDKAANIELKNKSSFVLETNSRNPFWPIGWKPVVKQTNTNEQAGPDISPAAFLVSSIMMGNGTHFAIINGKPMQEGQVFGLQVGNQVYQVTVKTIEDGQVILQRRDQEFAVPLRRK
jgi:hypothetical protein